MTRYLHILLILAFLAMVLLFSSCFRSKPKMIQVNPAFARYVSGYTSGMVSCKQGIRIELAAPYGKTKTMFVPAEGAAADSAAVAFDPVLPALPDSAVLKNIFEFEPAIKGKAVWISDRLIEFLPEEPLPANQFYTATFKLGKVASVERDFREFQFQFASYQQVMSVSFEGLRTYDNYNTEWMKLSGSISTSDYADPEQLKKTISAKIGNTAARISWSSFSTNECYFYIDSIRRGEKRGKIKLEWNGEPILSRSEGREEIDIPAMGDFSVESVNVIDNGDQYLEVSFSDPILYNQNLKGIVTVSGADNPTFVIEGNAVKVYPGLRMTGEKTVSVSAGIRNFKGYKMNEPYSGSVVFEDPKPRVRLSGNGVILPNSGGLIFPFESVSLKAVDVRVLKIYQNNVHQFLQVNSLSGSDGLTRVGKVIAEKTVQLDYDKSKDLKQWNSHVIDLAKLISPDPGAIYRVSIKFRKEYAICNCDEETEEGEDNEAHSSLFSQDRSSDSHDWDEDNWHSYGFDDGYDEWYGYYEDDERSPCDEYYYNGKAVNRNIIASDLGMIYKLDDDKMSHAFISNMISTAPVGGCTVEYFDYTKQVIAQGVTDANGMLDIRLSRKPFLMVASYGKQKGYLKLLDGEANSLSKFDIEGEVVQKGVKGLIYGERGVWRPGDSLYLNFILEDKGNLLPPAYPVKFELQDPNGSIVSQCTRTENVNGLYDFRTATGEDAATGTYTAVARVGNRLFTQSIKIETVKPNRLKIYFNVPDDKLSSKNGNDTLGRLKVQWLHGATAKNLHTVVNLSMNQYETSFAGFKDYEFDSPLRNYYSDATTIFDGFLDNEGEAVLKSTLPAGTTAPGFLRANFVTRVYEEGGDFSIDRYNVRYSPYRHYVGISTPATKNYDNTLETGQSYKLNIASVDESGKPVSLDKVQLRIYKIGWRFWYESSEEDLASYMSRSSTIVFADTVLKTTAGHASYSFKVTYPEYGRYLITVSDLQGGHQSGKTVTVDWPYWSRGNRNTGENASMLNFFTDKTSYTKGEHIKLSFPSPANGRALVSIETGTKVIKKTWISTQQGETRYEFEATADMSPSAYIHVTMLQPHASTVNDLPIRMYGITPVTVDDPATHLTPLLATTDVWKPESNASIRVREQNGKAMIYTLAVVDEGLLDLTRFKTPQPWNTFYAREALGVQTWDMYDAVIGAYAGKLDKLISIGGDGEGTGGKGVKANRFKPMVRFIGPFTLAAGQQKTHNIDIPNYVGSVRVMLVAEHKGAYGNAEKTVAVRKPLMVLATLPRVLGPAETVSLPVDVFAMEKHVKDIKVSIEVNELLSIDGAKTQNISFDRTGDEVISFKLNVAEKTGIARVKVTAVSGKEKATQEIELDVRLANPKVTDADEFVLEPGKSLSDKIVFTGLKGTNRAVIEVSSIPSIALEKHLSYLIQYPHGCIEQTTSSVFPQLFVNNLTDLKETQKSAIARNVRAGLKRLQLFQTSNGGFSYWPGEGYDNEWGSNYAGHFMLEAEKQGYSLPQNMKSKWVKYQQQQAKNWADKNTVFSHPHGDESYQHIQAYRLYVLALSNNAELGAMNRMREQQGLTATAKWRLAAAYRLVGQAEVARQLIASLPVTVKTYKELSYSYGSDMRDEAMILETLSLMKEKEKAAGLARRVAERLSKAEWLSTQEAAYSLMAMSEYTGGADAKTMSFTYSLNDKDLKKEQSSKAVSQFMFDETQLAGNSIVKLSNTGSGTLFVKVMTEGIPLTGDKSVKNNHIRMAVRYLDMKGVEIQPDKLVQGTDFMAEVVIQNPGTRGSLKEMALSQIFASGWEIHNARMDGTAEGDDARYKDIRDDRVYSYYDLESGGSKTFRVKLNATYLGRFYLPTVYSEAMYDNSINARVPGRWVEVIKDPGTMAMIIK